MRDVDGDEWDVCLQVLGGNRRRDRFVGLKLDGQIDSFMDELVGAAESGFRFIAIIRDNELDMGLLRGAAQAGQHFAGEGAVLTLRSVTDTITLGWLRLRDQPVLIFPHLVQEPAFTQGVEKAEAHGLVQAGPAGHFPKAKDFARKLERR